ncbi:hypothetical protein [Microbacterium immunditiarum]|uniref:Protein kinase domain-containing protein n=1 Tax=Microbacterium immunditiarum TaxID=337480 RepID=A0A7Y9GLN4_9MICO|nr:hypothetical protein [Microbacterium immunditiarum]NYE18717.1 hypothetical protein [Microbacterium immunditiarum]
MTASDIEEPPRPRTLAPLGRTVYEDPGVRRTLLSRVLGRAKMVRLYGTPITCTFVKSADHSVTVFSKIRGQEVVGKYFLRTEIGRANLAAERRSHELFGDRPWRMPVVKWHRQGFSVPRLSDGARLDVASEKMTRDERLDISATALDVLLEMYMAGYLHGDLQPHNIWLLEGRPVATDFETSGPRTQGIPFLESGDITGHDPNPRRRKIDTAFDPEDKWSFHYVLGVTLEQALETLRARLEQAGTPEARRKLAVLDGALPEQDEA